MYYEYTLTIPANTPSSAPVREVVSLCPGTITKVDIFFVPDCAGYVGVRVLRFEHQLWPTNPDVWFRRNEDGPDWEESFPLDDDPYELIVEGYNEDDSYAHDVILGFAVIPTAETMAGVFKKLFAPTQRVSLEI